MRCILSRYSQVKKRYQIVIRKLAFAGIETLGLEQSSKPPQRGETKMTTPRNPSASAPAPAPQAPAPQAPAPGKQGAAPAPTPAPPVTGENGKGKPGRKPGQPAKEYDFSGISLDAINAPKAVTAEMASRMAPSRPRDDRQIAMDIIVRKTHAAWVSAGKPSKWAAMPKVQYDVAPAAEEAFTYLVRRAAEFLGVAIKWGGNPSGTKLHNENGDVVIMFAVRDRRTRDTVDDTEDDDDDDDNTSQGE